MATTFLYRCPNTGQTVQGWSADDATDDDTSYQSVAGPGVCADAPYQPKNWKGAWGERGLSRQAGLLTPGAKVRHGMHGQRYAHLNLDLHVMTEAPESQTHVGDHLAGCVFWQAINHNAVAQRKRAPAGEGLPRLKLGIASCFRYSVRPQMVTARLPMKPGRAGTTTTDYSKRSRRCPLHL